MTTFDSDSGQFPFLGLAGASLIAKLRRLADDLEDINTTLAAHPPTASMNSWTLGWRRVPCLVGRPTGHPIISDGRPACSSELFYLDQERGIARTMSRWYSLGACVDPGYWDEWLPLKFTPSGDSH